MQLLRSDPQEVRLTICAANLHVKSVRITRSVIIEGDGSYSEQLLFQVAELCKVCHGISLVCDLVDGFILADIEYTAGR